MEKINLQFGKRLVNTNARCFWSGISGCGVVGVAFAAVVAIELKVWNFTAVV